MIFWTKRRKFMPYGYEGKPEFVYDVMKPYSGNSDCRRYKWSKGRTAFEKVKTFESEGELKIWLTAQGDQSEEIFNNDTFPNVMYW